jgi:hypothetical protein
MGYTTETIFKTVDEWWEACAFHGHLMLSHDDPMRRLIGYSCYDCDVVYYIELLKVKAVPSSHWLAKELRTAVSRQRLPHRWLPWTVLILEEHD